VCGSDVPGAARNPAGDGRSRRPADRQGVAGEGVWRALPQADPTSPGCRPRVSSRAGRASRSPAAVDQARQDEAAWTRRVDRTGWGKPDGRGSSAQADAGLSWHSAEDEARILDLDPACLQYGHPVSLHLVGSHLCLATAAHGRACECTGFRPVMTPVPEAGEPPATSPRGDAWRQTRGSACGCAIAALGGRPCSTGRRLSPMTSSPAPLDLDALAARYAVPARAVHDLAARRRAGAHDEELLSLLRQPDWGGLSPERAAQLVADLPG